MSKKENPVSRIQRYRTKVGPGGRVVIPAELRRALEIEIGDEVILYSEDGELRLYTHAMAIERAQQLVRKYVPEGVNLADELIADRRREAAQEEAEAREWRLRNRASKAAAE